TPPRVVPPITIASLSPAPNTNGWSNTNVTVTFRSINGAGSGIQGITYSASGAQPIASVTVAGSSTSISITSEGITTITFFAQANTGDTGAPETVVVKLDKTPPTVTYSGNAGVYTVDQPVNITCNAADS